VSDTSCCRRKLKIICNSIPICTHSDKVYTWAYTMEIRHFWISIVKYKGGVSWSLGPTGKLFSARGKKKVGPTALRTNTVIPIQWRETYFFNFETCAYDAGCNGGGGEVAGSPRIGSDQVRSLDNRTKRAVDASNPLRCGAVPPSRY
jgi:hypothetical protein